MFPNHQQQLPLQHFRRANRPHAASVVCRYKGKGLEVYETRNIVHTHLNNSVHQVGLRKTICNSDASLWFPFAYNYDSFSKRYVHHLPIFAKSMQNKSQSIANPSKSFHAMIEPSLPPWGLHWYQHSETHQSVNFFQ